MSIQSNMIIYNTADGKDYSTFNYTLEMVTVICFKDAY